MRMTQHHYLLIAELLFLAVVDLVHRHTPASANPLQLHAAEHAAVALVRVSQACTADLEDEIASLVHDRADLVDSHRPLALVLHFSFEVVIVRACNNG